MRKFSLAIAAASMTVPMAATIPTTAAVAHDGYYKGKSWKDNRGRWRCKRPDGTTGMLIGGAAGALAGRAIDTRGERATGTILGAAAGALLGREIERGRSRCR